MTVRRLLPTALLLSSVLALMGGCVRNTLSPPTQKGEPALQDRTFLRRHSLVRPGSALDLENRHASTLKVSVKEKFQQEPGTTGECSGVLIAPRLVLTAGHCVCIVRQLSDSERDALSKEIAASAQPGTGAISRAKTLQGIRIDSIIDSSRCAQTAKVTAIIYEPREPGKTNKAQTEQVNGRVKPHPRFEIFRDANGSDVWASADLAVILLDSPMGEVPVARLATTETQETSAIGLTGFGAGDTTPTYEDRHYGQNQITWLRKLDSGSVEIVAAMQRMPDGKPGSHLEGGDSGGGCWSRTEDGGEVLIGIASGAAQNRQGQTFSIFTSLHPHEGWLRRQQEEALKEAGNAAPTR